MDKLKFKFIIKIESDLELTKSEVEEVKKCEAEGKDIILVDVLKSEVANTFGLAPACVELLEQEVSLVEG